jgi:transcriptional regulator with XRE-family HTH domain
MASIKKPKRTRQKHFFKEWRKFRKIGQAKAIELLGWSPSKISRIETGVTPYNQDDLETAAEIFKCEPKDILTVNPFEVDVEMVMFDEQLIYDVVETLFDTYPPISFVKHSPQDMAELIVLCAKTELAHPSQPEVMNTVITLTNKAPKGE